MDRPIPLIIRGNTSLAERAARLANARVNNSDHEEMKVERLTKPKDSPIPVVRTVQPLPKQPEDRSLRVAAYCRISDDVESQRTSISNQREHWKQEISQHPGWELVDIYWESGVSGTKKENRSQLKRLIADCEAHRVDMVVTKSVSRFARNTADCLEMLRKLKALGVTVWFQKEQIDTGTADGELMLTLYATFAAEESHSIQANTMWGVRRKFQDGTRRFSIAPFGYDIVDGNYVVNQEQAPIVKEIFNNILSGKGSLLIARELNERGIPTGTRKRNGTDNTWSSNMILGIVKNIAYTGDMLMQKTFHDETFKRYNNYGERPQYFAEGHHKGIIDRDTFEAANEAIRQRGKEKNTQPQEDRSLRADPHQNRYEFSGKLRCGCCGAVMKRTIETRKSGIRVYWVCTQHLRDKDACPMKRILDDDVKNAFLTMMNKLYFARDTIIPAYMEQLRFEEMVSRGTLHLQMKLEQNKAEFNRLTAILKSGSGEPVSIRRELYRLERENEDLCRSLTGNSQIVTEAATLKCIVAEWGIRTEWEEQAFTELVDSVTIHKGKSICFHLKCGMTLTEYSGNRAGSVDKEAESTDARVESTDARAAS